MSDTSILPGLGREAVDPDPNVPASDADSVGGDNRRKLLMAGAGAGVIIVGAAAFFLLHGGGSSTPDTLAPVPHGVVSHKAAAATKTKPGSTTLPKVDKHRIVRDPFAPIITAPVATTGSASSTTVSATSTSPATSTTTTTPVTTTTTPVTTTSNAPAGSPIWIELVKTNGDKTATFKVGYRHHQFRQFTVSAPAPSADKGTVFDKEFALIGVQNGQATLQVGDATPFDLAKGVAHVL
jgi:hypothetical protein